MQAQVAEFHNAVGILSPTKPGVHNAGLRLALILEELQELGAATGFHLNELNNWSTGWHKVGEPPPPPDLIGAIDAIADLLYVVLGTAVEFGIDIEPFFDEVHRSNMTKIGGAVREDGKRLKPPHYEPPNLAPILRRQEAAARRAALETSDD